VDGGHEMLSAVGGRLVTNHDWEDCIATCAAHLRSALLILDDLACHPQSSFEVAFAYDLASRATCIALVSLDECQLTRRVTAQPRKPGFP
jgi:hypothetical protein